MEENKLYKCPECGCLLEHDELIEVSTGHLPEGNNINLYLKLVCDFFDVTYQDLCDKNRVKNTVLARRMFFHIACKYEGNRMSLVNIGKVLKKDHATVMHHRNRMRDEMELYEDIRVVVQEFEAKVRYEREKHFAVNNLMESIPKM